MLYEQRINNLYYKSSFHIFDYYAEYIDVTLINTYFIHTFISSLYNMMRKGDYGEFHQEAPNLLKSIENKLAEMEGVKYIGSLTDQDQVVVSFATPLMLRGHTLR